MCFLAASFSSVHLIPQAPRNASSVSKTMNLVPTAQYLIDGRVGTLNVAFDWDAAAVDLDASAIVYDDKLRRVDVVWWDKKTSKFLSVAHLGDDQTGDKKGDKEVIQVGAVSVVGGMFCCFCYGFTIAAAKSLFRSWSIS